MATYYFIYSVDVQKSTGAIESNLMLLDHEEVQCVISQAKYDGDAVVAVNVSMYDELGECVNERDITKMYAGGGN